MDQGPTPGIFFFFFLPENAEAVGVTAPLTKTLRSLFEAASGCMFSHISQRSSKINIQTRQKETLQRLQMKYIWLLDFHQHSRGGGNVDQNVPKMLFSFLRYFTPRPQNSLSSPEGGAMLHASPEPELSVWERGAEPAGTKSIVMLGFFD